MIETEVESPSKTCCKTMFFAHYVGGRRPLVVLECCKCGQLWHRREDGSLVMYDQQLLTPLKK